MLKRQIKNEESEEERIMRIKAERLRARWMDKELIDVFKRYQKQLREQKSSQFDEGMNPYLKGQKQSYLAGTSFSSKILINTSFPPFFSITW